MFKDVARGAEINDAKEQSDSYIDNIREFGSFNKQVLATQKCTCYG